MTFLRQVNCLRYPIVGFCCFYMLSIVFKSEIKYQREKRKEGNLDSDGKDRFSLQFFERLDKVFQSEQEPLVRTLQQIQFNHFY